MTAVAKELNPMDDFMDRNTHRFLTFQKLLCKRHSEATSREWRYLILCVCLCARAAHVVVHTAQQFVYTAEINLNTTLVCVCLVVVFDVHVCECL